MIRFEDNQLFIDEKLIYTFNYTIGEILDSFENIIIVRLKFTSKQINIDKVPDASRNVYGIDYEGNLIWQIPADPIIDNSDPNVKIHKKDDILQVLNWDGSVVTLNPFTGEVIEDAYTHNIKNPGRPW